MDKLKKISKVSLEGRTANNMLFIGFDIMEVLIMVSETESGKVGLTYDKRTSELLNELKYVIKDLRKRTTEISEKEQYQLGEDAEKLLTLLLVSVDRTGDNNRVMDIITNYAKSFKSINQLRLNKFGI